MAFGKQDDGSDEEPGFGQVTDKSSINGVDYSLGYNVDLEGNAEVSVQFL